MLLAGVLVALNFTLWFAAPGLALRKAIVRQLFGPSMVRAQVHLKSGEDWNLDRGVITKVNSTQLTLREFDGRSQQIPLSGTTKVIRRGQRLPAERTRASLARGRVVAADRGRPGGRRRARSPNRRGRGP